MGELIYELDHTWIRRCGHMPVFTVIGDKSVYTCVNNVVLALIVRQGTGHKRLSAVAHKPCISILGVSWISVLGQYPVGSICNIPQGIEQGTIQIENYGFAIHGVFV